MDRTGMTSEDFNFLVLRYGSDTAEKIYRDYRSWCLKQNRGVFDPEAYSRHLAAQDKQGRRQVSHRYEAQGLGLLSFFLTLALTTALMWNLQAPGFVFALPLVLAFAASFGVARLHARWRKI